MERRRTRSSPTLHPTSRRCLSTKDHFVYFQMSQRIHYFLPLGVQVQRWWKSSDLSPRKRERNNGSTLPKSRREAASLSMGKRTFAAFKRQPLQGAKLLSPAGLDQVLAKERRIPPICALRIRSKGLGQPPHISSVSWQNGGFSLSGPFRIMDFTQSTV